MNRYKEKGKKRRKRLNLAFAPFPGERWNRRSWKETLERRRRLGVEI
jgi:hypothetical protein